MVNEIFAITKYHVIERTTVLALKLQENLKKEKGDDVTKNIGIIQDLETSLSVLLKSLLELDKDLPPRLDKKSVEEVKETATQLHQELLTLTQNTIQYELALDYLLTDLQRQKNVLSDISESASSEDDVFLEASEEAPSKFVSDEIVVEQGTEDFPAEIESVDFNSAETSLSEKALINVTTDLQNLACKSKTFALEHVSLMTEIKTINDETAHNRQNAVSVDDEQTIKLENMAVEQVTAIIEGQNGKEIVTENYVKSFGSQYNSETSETPISNVALNIKSLVLEQVRCLGKIPLV